MGNVGVGEEIATVIHLDYEELELGSRPLMIVIDGLPDTHSSSADG